MDQQNADLLIAEFLAQWGYPDAAVNESMEQDLRALLAALGWRATPPVDPVKRPKRAYCFDD
jgi:hypothetical protein